MKYYSTRNNKTTVMASEAIASGLAPDGGLFVPESLPELTLKDIEAFSKLHYRERAERIMGLFLDQFSSYELRSFVTAAYGENYDDAEIAPVRKINDNTAFLELWHGPTCAFKDMALQMLPHLLTASLRKNGETKQVCILVATSGDTGKAALEGFRDVDGTSILVFYPRDGVSDVQKLQMTTQEGSNVRVCAVKGNFDDAQSGVKRIFSDRVMAQQLSERGYFLSSANSINWGRLLPQIVYYVSAYCDCIKNGMIKLGDKLDFCVPTGNFGNILAGWYAKQMGLPVGRFICASNSNNVLTEFIESGVYDRNRPFYTTTSPSMDILVSSNLERLLYSLCNDSGEIKGYMSELSEGGRYQVSEKIRNAIASEFSAGCCDDERTAQTIKQFWDEYRYLIDTHTAVAAAVLQDHREKTGESQPVVIVSTASPFKFCDSVIKALGGNADMTGAELVPALSGMTGVVSPKPLTGLDKRAVRFSDCVDSLDMESVVSDFLK